MNKTMNSLALLSVGLLACLHGVTSSATANCELDDDMSTARHDRCMDHGHSFIRFLLARQSRRQRLNDICTRFTPFRDCYDSIQQDCGDQNHRFRNDWSIVYNVIKCACDGTKSCKDSLNCFMGELHSPLGKECHVRYPLEANQTTLHRCHFLYDSIRCKEALVESACSPEGGVFAFHLARIVNYKHILDYGCNITRDNQYTGFRYTDQCPANMSSEIRSCSAKFLNNHLTFQTDFDLIPRGPRWAMRKRCGDYRKYKECVTTIKENCPHGLRKLYDIDGKERTYFLKMDYICGEGSSAFKQQLRCYRDLLSNNTLSSCNPLWNDLQPQLESTNEHQFYCRRNSNKTLKLRQMLGELRSCYEQCFAASCPEGSAAVAALMENVFEDPLYLRYRYHPDCQLHEGPPLSIGFPPGTIRPRLRPRPTRRPRPRPKTTTSEPEAKPNYVAQNDQPTGSASSLHQYQIVLSLVSLVLVTLHT